MTRSSAMQGSHGRIRNLIDRFLSERSFDEAVVLMCLGLAIAVIAPLSVFRAAAGAWLNAGFDALVALAAAAIAVYLWRSRRADVASWLTALACLGVLVAVVYLFGPQMLFWAYPGTMVTFFLLRPSIAAQLNVLALVLVAPRALEIGPSPEVITFFVTIVTSNVLALIFAANMHRSRSLLRVLAERDPLTGAGNRHALDLALAEALKRHRGGVPISMLIADIDRFKPINDTYGHEAGDRVLVEVAHVIDRSIRTGDDLYRYGGDELLVLAHGAPLLAASQLAEKLRERVFDHFVEGVGNVAVSLGVAEARYDDTPESWFRRADAMLYKAKRDGRNRVCSEEGPQLPLGIP